MAVKASRVLRWVAITMLLVLIASAIVMVIAGEKYGGISGINRIAQDAQGRLLINLNEDIARLSPDGVVETRFDLGGVDPESRAAFVPMPSGYWWLANYSNGTLMLMSPEGKRIKDVSPPPAVGPFFKTFHMAYEPQSDRLLVADSQNHRLLAFDGEGEFIAVSANDLQLRYPTGMAALPDGTLLLANMNRHEVMKIRSDLSRDAMTIEAGDAEYRFAQFVSTAPDGRAYVSWLDHQLKRGTVTAYDANGIQLHALDLGDDAEPLGMLARTDDVLASWRTHDRFYLHRFDLSGRDLGEFESNEIQDWLRTISGEKLRWRQLRNAAKYSALGSAMLLLIVALAMRRQQEQAAASAVAVPLPKPAITTSVRVIVLTLCVFILTIVIMLAGLTAPIVGKLLGTPHFKLILRATPWVVGLAIFGLALAWRSTRTFVDLRAGLARRAMREWAPYLHLVLRSDEWVEGHETLSSLWRGYLLIATNQRLLQISLEAGEAVKPIWEIPLTSTVQATLVRRTWWQVLINPVARIIEIDSGTGQNPLRAYSLNRRHGEQVCHFVQQSRDRALQAPERPETLAPPMPKPALKQRPLAESLMLSVVFPGLGHLAQGRTRRGTVLMLFALLLLAPGLIRWFVAINRIADQSVGSLWASLIMYAALVVLTVVDVIAFHRRTHS